MIASVAGVENGDRTCVTIQELANDEEAKPPAIGSATKKWLEHLSATLRWHPWSSVGHFERVPLDRKVDARRGAVARLHPVLAVQQQVVECLNEAPRTDQDVCGLGERQRQLDPAVS